MILITCCRKDCPTPYFYVDPKGGRIPITAAADAPTLMVTPSNVREVKPIIQQVGKDPDATLTKEDEAIITQWWRKLQEQNNEFDDYMVVYCESGHQNYVPFKNKHRKKKRDDRQAKAKKKNKS